MPAARTVVERSLAEHIRDQVERGVVRDFKTSLQEHAVRQRGAIPEYRITASGPDHAKRFDAQVFLVGELLGEGTGRSKKEAEQAAAKRALPKLQ
jgi:ribonuclease III